MFCHRLNYPLKLRKWHHACASWNGKTGEWQLWVKAERVGRGFHNRVCRANSFQYYELQYLHVTVQCTILDFILNLVSFLLQGDSIRYFRIGIFYFLTLTEEKKNYIIL